MPKYSTYFPVPASAKFTVEVPEGSTPEQIREALLIKGEPQSSLCYQCGKSLEIDDTAILDDDIEEEFDYWKEQAVNVRRRDAPI